MKVSERGFSRLMLGLGWVSFSLFIVFFLQFSWGGQAFGIRGSFFDRWFRPYGAIVAFATSSKKVFSVANLNGQSPLSPKGHKTDGATFLWDRNYVLLENGSKYWGNQYFYKERKSRKLAQRTVAFSLSMPFYQTNMGIFLDNGLYRWEAGPSKMTGNRWCGKECWFAIKALPCRGTQVLELGAHRRDVFKESPLQVTSTSRVVAGLTEARKARFTKDDASTVLDFDGSASSSGLKLIGSEEVFWGWKVEIHVDRVYNPYKSGDSADNRDLGVKLLGLFCEA